MTDMEFISTSLNPHLLIQDSYFEYPENNNIDLIISNLITSNQIAERRNFISAAIKNIEKFHSYFHFEQSFFHTQYAKYLFRQMEIEKAIDQYKLAIFQDHLNIEAHKGLIMLLPENSVESLEAIEYAKRFNIKISDNVLEEYQRPYLTYEKYVAFATHSSGDFIKNLSLPKNRYYENVIPKKLDEVIASISFRHKQYHKNAAIIYLNYCYVLLGSKEEELAKNALIKSRNLDPEISKDIEILSY